MWKKERPLEFYLVEKKYSWSKNPFSEISEKLSNGEKDNITRL